MRFISVSIAVLLAASAASAHTLSLTDVLRGRYTTFGDLQHNNYSTVAGSTEYRSFFVFEIPPLSGVDITGVKLRMNTGTVTGGTVDIPVRFTSTTLTPAQLHTSASSANFNSLGVGTVFGERIYRNTDANLVRETAFTSAGIEAVTNAIGSYIVISGRVMLPGTSTRSVFGHSSSNPVSLVIDYQDAPPPALVPLPGTAGLAAAGMVVGGLARRRRR